uniref:Influenza virus NS1A-binding protein n=1 Tax=Ascaris suum TaxID=6253 RepID=F1KX05_ASCSU
MQLGYAANNAESMAETVYGEEPPKFTLTGDQVSNVRCSKQRVPSKASAQEKPSQLTFVPKRMRNAVSMRDDDTDTWGNDEVDHKEEFMLMLVDPAHRDSLLNRLNTFRRNRELCDVVLFVREKEILAHKVVLAAVSPALFDMFVRDDREAAAVSTNNSPPPMSGLNKSACSSKSSIPSATFAQTTLLGSPTQQPLAYYEFAQADYDCFTALVNFAYTSQLEVSSKKVGELYKTAFSLQMGPVVSACAQFLAQNLSVANCIGVRKQANFSNDEQLVGKVDSFISENFPQIVDECVEFTQLTCIKVRIIVNLDDAKQARSGMNLAERALQYFQSLPTNSDRAEVIIEQLADKTHLLYVEEDQTLQDCAEIDDRSSVGSCDIIQDYKKTGGHQSRTITTGVASVGTVAVQHHVTGATPVHLNASRITNNKFSSNESINSIATTSSDPDEEILSKLIAVHQASGDFWIALAVLHHRLVTLSLQLTENEDIMRPNQRATVPYVDTKLPTDSLQQQQIHERAALLARMITTSGAERTPLPEMNDARCSIGAAFLNGKIIVCGGYDRGECLRSAEEYDVLKGEWRQLADMSFERGRFDAAVAAGKVYAIAGSNGNVDLKTAECYDPKSGKWNAIRPLQRGRSHNACTSLDGFIYCVGGSSEQVVLKECERYDPEKDEWEHISPMQTARFQAGCTAWRGMVVACGGCDRWNCLDTVEAYHHGPR